MPRLEEFQAVPAAEFFEGDRGFKTVLGDLMPEADRAIVLSSLGECADLVAGRWSELAVEGSLNDNLPKIVKSDRADHDIQQIDFGRPTRQLRREVAGFGVLSKPRNELHKFGLIYLLSHNGEASLTCGISCTDGAIRAIEAKGSGFLQKTYLSRLRSIETPFAGAQFVTEQTGGSDVGAIESEATPNQDGSWSIRGEKWFCSNPDEYFVVAARPRGAPAGTDGVAIFFVPRLLPDGRPNTISFRRLKDKLGTKSLPTAEIDFHGAIGYAIGDPAEGFKTLMNYVINTSRIHNAVNACGFLHRAFIEARNYARQREAFGHRIIEFPLVQETLLSLLERLWRFRLMTFRTVALLDQHGMAPRDPSQALWQRFLINLIKYRSSSTLTRSILEAIQVLGGNGIVEDFSILPRLLRDAVIIETWEGTHNTLCLQILRDAARGDLLDHWSAEVESVIGRWPRAFLPLTRGRIQEAYEDTARLVAKKSFTKTVWAQIHARRFVDRLGGLLEMAWMVDLSLRHAGKDALIPLLCGLSGHQLFGEGYAKDDSVLDAARAHATALIEEEPVLEGPSAVL